MGGAAILWCLSVLDDVNEEQYVEKQLHYGVNHGHGLFKFGNLRELVYLAY